MEMHPLGEMMETTMTKIKEMVDVKPSKSRRSPRLTVLPLNPVSRALRLRLRRLRLPREGKSGFGAPTARGEDRSHRLPHIKDGTVRMIISRAGGHYHRPHGRCSRIS
jgi:hypothetical protein